MAAALWGGIAGAIAMALVYSGFLGLRLTRFDLLRFAGGTLTRERGGIVYVYGVIVHVVVGALLGLAFGYLFSLLGSATYVFWGALFGLAAAVLLLLALPLLARANQEVRHGTLAAPGLAGRAYGALTPVALAVALVVFGLWVGLVVLPSA